ncbi:MAG TPA: CPBP family intramembrane metalloprotease [Euryarchaeota archaeon]|nr:CAAX amino terminal protease self- immunity [archaeon BMS3Bbin16]HDH28417.1 CPBP family intramembrane metalloprotease [Euryarchaeota archaeon]
MIRVVAAFLILLVERSIAFNGGLNLWQWIGVQTILFTLIPLLAIGRFNIKPGDFGLAQGDLRFGLKTAFMLIAIALPLMAYGASQPAFKAYYPIWAPARTSALNFIFLELAVLLMMFNTEFYFRGLLLFSLDRSLSKQRMGRWIAVLADSSIYMLAHLGKPGLEVQYSFFVGIVFGWLALKSKSIFPSLAAHWISSVIFDLMVIVL